LDLSSLIQIRLVPHKNDQHIAIHEEFSLPDPLLGIVERVGASDIIDNDNGISIAVIRSSQSLEAFLTARVPYLKLNSLIIIDSDRLDIEINTNGGDVCPIKVVVGKLIQDGCLSRIGVTHNEDFIEGGINHRRAFTC
jgi:hypothetical protein